MRNVATRWREAEAAYYLMGTESPDVMLLRPLQQTAPRSVADQAVHRLLAIQIM